MKKIIMALGIIILSSLTAEAFVDTGHMTTKQYMLNSGYSSNMATMAEITTRDPYAPTDDLYPERSTKRFLQLFWKKIDPAAFPDINNSWHDIKESAGFSDLN